MKKINKYFMVITIVEIIFGGGGRLFELLGIIPARYVLFAISFFVFFMNVFTKTSKCNLMSVLLLICFLIYPIYGALLGTLYGNNLADIFFDVQPYIYTLILFYFLTLSDELKDFAVSFFLKSVKFYGAIAAAIYIGYLFLLHLGLIDFIRIYNILSETNEFFFRPSGAFFAKSFFFLGISAIIFFVEKKYLTLLIVLTAMLLTETRGVFLFTSLALLMASFKINRISINMFFIFIGAISFILLLVIVGQRAGVSDSTRISDWIFYTHNLDPITFIFGAGFGTFIIDRLRIEVVPLEILLKTGIVGVLITLIPFIAIIRKGYFQFNNDMIKLTMSCIAIFSLGVSITNPFLYTPMGIFVTGIVAIVISSKNMQNNDLLKK